MAGAKQISKLAKRENILHTLRERIVEGHYPQGVKLVEQDLAREFDTSRPMLREILSDLESQGLVEKRRNRGTTVFHLVGSCRMGPATDPHAVVDDQLRVHGIEGLRVADASIMPTMPSCNTNAPSIMIGEKASDMILEHRR